MATFNPGQVLTAAQLNALFDKIMADPVSTSSSGTAFTTTELLDSVLGTYAFTAVAGRRYRASYTGVKIGSGVANDYAVLRLRDGGASTPTNASTLLGESASVIDAAGGGGFVSLPVFATFTPTAGTHTLGIFGLRVTGTGTITPAGTRELYVEDIGGA